MKYGQVEMKRGIGRRGSKIEQEIQIKRVGGGV